MEVGLKDTRALFVVVFWSGEFFVGLRSSPVLPTMVTKGSITKERIIYIGREQKSIKDEAKDDASKMFQWNPHVK